MSLYRRWHHWQLPPSLTVSASCETLWRLFNLLMCLFSQYSDMHVQILSVGQNQRSLSAIVSERIRSRSPLVVCMFLYSLNVIIEHLTRWNPYCEERSDLWLGFICSSVPLLNRCRCCHLAEADDGCFVDRVRLDRTGCDRHRSILNSSLRPCLPLTMDTNTLKA